MTLQSRCELYSLARGKFLEHKIDCWLDQEIEQRSSIQVLEDQLEDKSAFDRVARHIILVLVKWTSLRYGREYRCFSHVKEKL